MKVKLTRDYIGIPKGTVLTNVVEFETLCYKGLWNSHEGSHFIIVPKQICKEIK